MMRYNTRALIKITFNLLPASAIQRGSHFYMRAHSLTPFSFAGQFPNVSFGDYFQAIYQKILEIAPEGN